MPQPAERQFVVRNEYLSVEPAMRGWVSAVANYSTPVGIGEVMRAFSAGRVVASRHPLYGEGDLVMGMLGWQDYALSDGSNLTRKVQETDLPLSLSLGVLGLNGVTAYFGLLDLGGPKPGDTLVVYRGWPGRFRRRADRQDDGLPHHWDRGWRGEMQNVPRGIRL
jgi:NADPH-dependent curcumin reductase CurA